MAKRPLKVLIGKPGLDGHDRGAKVVTRALMDAGMEVVYSGLHCSLENLVIMAVDEDVDILGLSLLNGAHVSYSQKIINMLRDRGAEDIAVTVGGNIPLADYEELKKIGVLEVFGNASLSKVVAFFEKEAEKKGH
ncbi:MAG: methylmalonyl-CoA mutase [Desulfosporosinus sp. BRH_c37]|nr:MAG: methylmalonyl-CoA mutase [Desulfosporosinus sp. BRH_c37]